jgi:hypothetical protein
MWIGGSAPQILNADTPVPVDKARGCVVARTWCHGKDRNVEPAENRTP